MSTTADRHVDQYVKRLDAELADLPRARRRELVQEISEHIAEARADLETQSEAEIRTLLDRLGDPADIAHEARERFGVRPRKPRALEIAALVMLLVGGIVLPIVGWLVGVVLLWISDAWSTRDKLLGTFVLPGGLLAPLGLGLVSVDAENCSQVIQPATGVVTEVCTGGTSTSLQILWLVLVVALILAPIATTVYLARRMRRRYQPSDASA